MDVCQQEKVLSPSCSKLSNFSTGLDDLFSAQNTEVDFSLEWLSVFVEDCFSSQAASCCLLAPSSSSSDVQSSKPSTPSLEKAKLNPPHSLQNFVVPGKARSKRKRLSAPRTRNPLSIWSHHLNPKNETLHSDPPLLNQAYWLADSELIVPKKEKIEQEIEKNRELEVKKEIFVEDEIINNGSNSGPNPMMPRRCSHCLAQRTPQWRAGPLGPKTLCNACGVRYKSGRLLPEYRPAKSPTFVSYLHSNSHKKVLEMRMATSIPLNERASKID